MPFIGDQATSNSKIKKYSFTATASQTAFSVISSSGDELQVFLNGVLLKETTDYTYTTSTVTLGSGATVSDIVDVHVYQSFVLVDAVKNTGDTMTGELEVPAVKLSSNIIKASGGTTSITTSGANVTLAGTANNVGTVTVGTLGSSVVFPTGGHPIRTFYATSATASINNTASQWADYVATLDVTSPTAGNYLYIWTATGGMNNDHSDTYTWTTIRIKDDQNTSTEGTEVAHVLTSYINADGNTYYGAGGCVIGRYLIPSSSGTITVRFCPYVSGGAWGVQDSHMIVQEVTG